MPQSIFLSFKFKHLFILFFLLVLLGCGTSSSRKGNVGNLQSFPISNTEAVWIMNGEPLIYEDDLWFPEDGVETLLDSEVYLLGEYNGVQFFADKIDVKPYDRLYTKFGKYKFRYFKKRTKEK